MRSHLVSLVYSSVILILMQLFRFGDALFGQADAAALFVYLGDHYFDDITYGDYIEGMLDPFPGQFADVDEAGFFQSDIHESTEVGDILDDTGHNGAGFQVLELHDALAGNGFRQVIADISPGSNQGIEDVTDGGQTCV